MTTTLRYAMNPRLGLSDITREPMFNSACHHFCKLRRANTGLWSGFFIECEKPCECDHCAIQAGIAYQKRVFRIMQKGTAYVALWTSTQLESFRRAYGGSANYWNLPVQLDGKHLVFHGVRGIADSAIVTQEWLNDYNWAELARQKDTTRNCSGGLGEEVKKDDGKESYKNIAFKLDKEVNEVGSAILVSVGNKVTEELGLAKSAQEAEAHTKRLQTLAVLAFIEAGIALTQYTIMHTHSRDEFEIKGIPAVCVESDMGNFEAELIMLGERYLADH